MSVVSSLLSIRMKVSLILIAVCLSIPLSGYQRFQADNVTKGSDYEATSSGYLQARFWDDTNYQNLIWEHYYEYICPQYPSHIGNVNLSMAGVNDRFESGSVWYVGGCDEMKVYENTNHQGLGLQFSGFTTSFGLLNNEISSYKLYR